MNGLGLTGDELDRLAANVRAVAVEFQRAMQNNADQLAQAAEQISESVERLARELAHPLQEFQRAVAALPFRQRSALETLANNGWYLDPEMSFPELFDFAEALDGDDPQVAHDALCSHFHDRVGSIEAELSRNFPSRSAIISAAAEAHREGKYALSVPVLLAQADGICKELLGVQLYSRRKELVAALRCSAANELEESLLSPLVESTPITASQGKRARGQLNRHAILHGESVDYDNELNSCRSLSFITYVAWMLADRRSDHL